jgi:hypothetical protein
VSFASDQWHMNTDDEYTAACARCEVWVDIVDAEHHAAILNVLHFDKRADGSRGRSLRRAVPPLLIHDRLEPNPTLPDVGDFDLLSVFLTVSYSGAERPKRSARTDALYSMRRLGSRPLKRWQSTSCTRSS